MAGKILTVLFWAASAALLGYSVYIGGWALTIPAAVVMAFLAFSADVYLHRSSAALDLELARTLAHVLSAVALAAACMYWLTRMLLKGGS